ncbi:hypothetical protein [Streptomyces sp. AC555_RSS877]|uniref:hypothetical protein n=1 Tax=Streptomyces sp. AC555_RSS877 TaxID=2823688 RepID=UPI0020B809FB|nr:hypothetical protein [Streptomyces sp. AC555_RSS877]
MRESYLASGLTLSDLSVRVRFAKSKLSELLRGVGLYPRWEIVYSLAMELGMPSWPLYRLWCQAAYDAHKSSEGLAAVRDRGPVRGELGAAVGQRCEIHGGRTCLRVMRSGQGVDAAGAGCSWRVRNSIWSRTSSSKVSPV